MVIDSSVSQFILIAAIVYGFVMFFMEIRKKSGRNKNQLGLSIALIIASIASFIMTIT